MEHATIERRFNRFQDPGFQTFVADAAIRNLHELLGRPIPEHVLSDVRGAWKVCRNEPNSERRAMLFEGFRKLTGDKLKIYGRGPTIADRRRQLDRL
ncbi:MAG: hypothetical protein HQK55_06025 [Deltaproteobacteria bacterium]|nr:hypothetical protein [Deltaproteobacteria bacterium]